jgi:hypothetical protein
MARFQKGQSGNPGGRPKIVGEVQQLARQHSAEAIETLVAIMQNEKAPPAARVHAANSILDRGYGRPPQAVINANVASKRALDYTDDELAAIIAAGVPEEDPTAH